MTGLDTTFLLELEIREHPGHEKAVAYLGEKILDAGIPLALASQVLCEFIHIATDPTRFSTPMSQAQAVERALFWWTAKEVEPVHPTIHSTRLFLDWMTQFRLGRKRILDTHLAAIYHEAGVDRILTTNIRDFSLFGCFQVITP